ncbi:MAG: hypothetical protein HY907_02745 [Deltaproteobacteria bacterium]|nr:hypothetical protein [Deltaproteobacteria bacterium]
MTRWWIVALAGAAATALPACGDDSANGDVPGEGADPGADADAGPDVEAEVEPEADGDGESSVEAEAEGDGAEWEVGPAIGTCATFSYELHEGHNEGFRVDDSDRAFEIRVPDAIGTATGPWPVVFVWHGVGNPVSQVMDLVAGEVNDVEHPFIAVGPEAIPLGLSTTPIGFDWDMLMWRDEANADVDLFDDVVACLDEAFDVDENRIYSMGFSAGALMTNLLSVARSEVLASIASFSGAYFSDPVQQMCFGSTCTTWPAFQGTAPFPALLVRGGPEDTYDAIPGLMVIDFDGDTIHSVEYLTTRGHPVLECAHDLGHELPPDLAGPQFLEYLFDHPKGTTPDPYATALPADFPSYCTFHPGE